MNRKITVLVIIGIIMLALFIGAQYTVQAVIDKPIVRLVRSINFSPQGVILPVSLAVDKDLNTYVIDGTAENPRVLKYDKQGRFLLEWGSRGSGPGQFEFWPANPDEPNAGFIAVDSQGLVYVSDSYNYRVQKFDPQGHFLMQFGELGTEEWQFVGGPGPIYIDKQDNVWVSTFPRVQKFDTQGNFLASYGTAGSGPGQFNGAGLGAIDSFGNMYIADLLNTRVQKLDASGNFLMAWGTSGTENGQFFMPVAIVLDDAGRLYIADMTDRIQVFNTDGQYLGQWTEPGMGYPPFSPLSGLAIDRKGDIYVTDIAIYVFRTRP